MLSINDGNSSDHIRVDDVDDASPQLQDVEALLREYSNSSSIEAGGEEEEDEDYAENGSSPILLSECPEFQAYLQPLELTENKETHALDDDDEIIFGFMPRRGKNPAMGDKDEEIAMWEFINDEAEALCPSEEDLAPCQGNDVAQLPVKSSPNRIPSPLKVNLYNFFALCVYTKC